VAISHYDGLSVSVQHRFAHGLQMQANSLWGHSLDEVSNGGLNPFIDQTSASGVGYGDSIRDPGQQNNLRQYNYGNADYDVRHSISANYVYELPKGPTPALKGWQLSGTVFWRTGFPYTPFNAAAQDTLDGTGYGGAVFANYTGSGHPHCSGPSGSVDLGINPCIPLSSFPDIAAGALPGSAPIGVGQAQLNTGTETLTRNQFSGPHYFDTDMTEVHANSALGDSEAGNWRPVLQPVQPPELRGAHQR
jgi:hypothetical protein